jgi:predicted metal-dependent hydrolase
MGQVTVELYRLKRRDYLKNKEVARKIILARLFFFNSFYGFQLKDVRIKNQRTCWGSCSEKGNLNFNFRIVYMPERVRDYIIVHELCHLKEFNHSRDFWRLVEKTIPEQKDIRKQLRQLR